VIGVRRKLLWVAVAVAFVLALISAADSKGFRRYAKLQRDLESLAEKNHQLADENAKMRAEMASLKSDKRALERAAREELGYVKPGEIVINVE
jgi:cell division protein FtsB